MAYGATNPDNEDFRSRYANETAGMPPALADIAARNLAANDASISNVNAVARLNPSQVVGSPYSTPQSDTTNLSVADAMDRADAFDRGVSPASVSTTTSLTLADAHNQDIQARRDQIEGQKKTIMANLGMIPPSEAGLAGVVLPSTDKQGQARRKEMLQSLAELDNESKNLLQEHHLNSIEAARTAHETLARETHIAAAKDFAAMSNDLLKLHQDPNMKPGTPEFQTAALGIANRHPIGFQTQAGQTLFRGIAEKHDAAATLEDRSYWQRFGQAFKEASQVARKLGTDVQYDDQGFPSIALTTQASGGAKPGSEASDKELFDAYGIRSTNLQNPLEVAVVDKGDSTGKGDSSGNFVKVRTLAKGQPTTVYMPKADYLRFGGKLSATDAATGAAPPAASPAATPAKQLSPQDQAAINWANSNPKDPRAIAIKKLHGIE